MKLNCKPGDLAIVIRPSLRGQQLLGMIVRVLRAAPPNDFRLPDGTLQVGGGPGSWVIEFPRTVEVPMQYRSGKVGTRQALFGVVDDHYLRPIRDPGDDAADETLQWLGVPSKEAA